MARISVKYPVGSKVSVGPTEGMVTGIFIRGRGRAYEFSYVDCNGDPKSATAEEVELRPLCKGSLGFSGKK